jgi:hypothetical protein
MSDLHIERHRARYHLGKSRIRDRYRLDAIAGAIFEDSPGTFLSDASWGEMEEVCIRSLEVVVPVELGASDRVLAERWSVAIAAAIRRAVASQSDSVIRYRSRRAAVLEMVSSICRDDRRREWAWRQIGLVPKGLASRAGEQVEDALLDDPLQIVPVIAVLAEDGLLPRIDELFDSPAWWRLAQGAARAAGATLPPGEDIARAVTPGVGELAQSIFLKSRIARAVTNFDSRALASDQGRGAVSALIVLEADPALFVLATGRALGVMSAIRGVLATPGFARHVPDTPGRSTTTGDPRTTLEGDRDTQKRQPGRQASTPDPEQPETLPDELASGDSEFDKLSASGATSVGSRTQWAGLLYLIHLVARLGIPEQVVNDETLGRRGLTWVLHQLALSLVPVESPDPAALAFAGMAPGSNAPDEDFAPPTPAEVDAVSSLRSMVVAELREALERRLDDEHLLVAGVTRRDAEIRGTAGWLDVHLKLDAVSMEVRRAGLDLDPGYVPWLGVVLRFLYE